MNTNVLANNHVLTPLVPLSPVQYSLNNHANNLNNLTNHTNNLTNHTNNPTNHANTLTEPQKKYCRCVLKVAAKQAGACNVDKAWYESRDGVKCYNPYAVCAKSTGTTSRECGKNYSFKDLSDAELTAYAQLSGIIGVTTYDRNTLLSKIIGWKAYKQ